jgi:hypothetical protein
MKRPGVISGSYFLGVMEEEGGERVQGKGFALGDANLRMAEIEKV